MYDVVYITNKYKVSEFAVSQICEEMELGKHYKVIEGRTKITQVGLMRIGKIIKKKRAAGEDLDLVQPDDERRVVESVMKRDCINNHLIQCVVGDRTVTVSVKPFVKKNFKAGKTLLIERIDDDTYVAPPRINA